MKKRFSSWLESNVYDMTTKQEQYLNDEGFSIREPEKINHSDKIIRDIPHNIINNNEKIQLKFNYYKGEFYVKLLNANIILNDLEKIKLQINKLDIVTKKLKTLD